MVEKYHLSIALICYKPVNSLEKKHVFFEDPPNPMRWERQSGVARKIARWMVWLSWTLPLSKMDENHRKNHRKNPKWLVYDGQSQSRNG